MKEYLIDFLNEFEYQENDAKILINTYDLIMQNNAAKDIFNNAISVYENDINCDFRELLALVDGISQLLNTDKYTVELLFSICLTKRLKKEYEVRKIDYEIYRESILDLRYKLEECKLVKGVVGTFVAFWFDGWFKLNRFALGRLQFEITKLGTDYQINGYKFMPDSKALGVHIPRSGQPLTPESCDKSFEKAREFFKSEFDGICIFNCHSWLLYPENEKLINENSNIYKFIKRFDVLRHCSDENYSDSWRIFDTEEKNFSLVPCNTSLQKAYAEHLINGGKMGWGFGVTI